MTNETEPLPCPFCGDQATHGKREDESLWSHKMVDWFSVGCHRCGFRFESEISGEALSQWNTRPTPDALRVAREALERIMESAVPNPREHPKMFEAWQHGKEVVALLAKEGV
jgi:C4-type Zn-finger protein